MTIDETPTFSVIMPVYNHADYVAEAVQSVFDQSFTDWELIAVDDGSKDDSPAIIDRLAAKHPQMTALHQANAGPAAARNTALIVAKAPWLTYIDSDDVWFPHTLEHYAGYIARHRDTQFIHGYRHRLDADGAITELPGQFQDAPSGAAELFERMFLSHLCVCYRRDLIDRVGGYDSDLRSCEDYELYLRMSLHCQFDPLGKPTGLRRRHGQNLSRQTGPSRFLEAQVLQRFVQDQGGADVLTDDAIARRLGRLYYASARQFFRAGAYRHAATAARRAHQYQRTFKSVSVGILSRLLSPFDRADRPDLPLLV